MHASIIIHVIMLSNKTKITMLVLNFILNSKRNLAGVAKIYVIG
jgi:hypothetical protein